MIGYSLEYLRRCVNYLAHDTTLYLEPYMLTDAKVSANPRIDLFGLYRYWRAQAS